MSAGPLFQQKRSAGAPAPRPGGRSAPGDPSPAASRSFHRIASLSHHGRQPCFTGDGGSCQIIPFIFSVLFPGFPGPFKALFRCDYRNDFIDHRGRGDGSLDHPRAGRIRSPQDGDRDPGEYKGNAGVGQQAFVSGAPKYAPKYLPAARARI